MSRTLISISLILILLALSAVLSYAEEPFYVSDTQSKYTPEQTPETRSYIPDYPFYNPDDFVAFYIPEDVTNLTPNPKISSDVNYRIQIGAYNYYANAAEIANKINWSLNETTIVIKNNQYYIVVSQKLFNLETAKEVAKYYASCGFKAWVRKWYYPAEQYNYPDFNNNFYDLPESPYYK